MRVLGEEEEKVDDVVVVVGWKAVVPVETVVAEVRSKACHVVKVAKAWSCVCAIVEEQLQSSGCSRIRLAMFQEHASDHEDASSSSSRSSRKASVSWHHLGSSQVCPGEFEPTLVV